MNIAALIKPLPRFFHRHKLVQLLLKISPSSKVQEVEFNGGAKLYADLSDGFPRAHFLNRSFEPEFFKIAAPFLSKGGTFVDAGANFGFCTFGLLHSIKTRPLGCHLFEANPEICRILQESKRFYPSDSIAINCVCLDERYGISHLKIVPENLGASYISPEGKHRVPNQILDEYLENNKIERVDFIKMDLEGYELRALAGLKRSLASRKIRAVYYELSTGNLARQGKLPVDVLEFMNKAGYRNFYVKFVDFQHGERFSCLQVNGQAIQVRPVIDFPAVHQTDILALPSDSEFLTEFNPENGFKKN